MPAQQALDDLRGVPGRGAASIGPTPRNRIGRRRRTRLDGGFRQGEGIACPAADGGR
jgi:hypothetical protein